MVGLTQQYLVGEASVLLAESKASGTETGPVGGLGRVALRALDPTDALCLDSLRRGDDGRPAPGRPGECRLRLLRP